MNECEAEIRKFFPTMRAVSSLICFAKQDKLKTLSNVKSSSFCFIIIRLMIVKYAFKYFGSQKFNK